MSDYVASQSRSSYYNADSRVPSRHWAAEKALHDLAEIGLIDFFEGPGPNPTLHGGYDSGKIWLRQNSGVQPQQGQFRVWTGDSPVSSEANWTDLTADRFFQLVTGGITNTIFPIATQPQAEGGITPNVLMDPVRTKQSIDVNAELGDFTPAAPAAVQRRLQDKGRDIISARDFGLVSGTSESVAAANTTKMQALIDELCDAFDEVNGFGSAVCDLGHGDQYIFDAVEITKPIAIRGGVGAEGTILRQRASVSESLLQFRMAYDSYNYYTLQSRPAQVVLENLKLIGGNQLAVLPNQHGIDLQNASSNSLTARVVMKNVDIQRFAGAGIYGGAFDGWVDGWGVNCHNNTVAGLSANTCFDWRLSHCNFYLNTGPGELLSGCGFFAHSLCNQWSNLTSGVVIFNAAGDGFVEHTWDGGTTDRNHNHGFQVDMRGAHQNIGITNRQFLLNANTNPGVYDDIHFPFNALGTVYVKGGAFGRTQTQAVADGTTDGYTRYHAGYVDAGGLAVFDPTVYFRGGALVENVARSMLTAEAAIRTKRTLAAEGSVVIGTNTAAAARNLDFKTAAGQNRALRFFSGANQRAEFGVSNAAESGANAGSDIYLNTFTDAGAYLATPVSIQRSNGRFQLSGQLRLVGTFNLASYADDAAAAAGGVEVGAVYRTGSALKIRMV